MLSSCDLFIDFASTEGIKKPFLHYISFFYYKYLTLNLKELDTRLPYSIFVLSNPSGYVKQLWVIEFNVTVPRLESCCQPYFREMCYLYYASAIDKTGRSTRSTNQTATLTCYQMSVYHLPGNIAVFNAYFIASKYALIK